MSWIQHLLPGRPERQLTAPQRARLQGWNAQATTDPGLSHFETRYVVVNTEASGLDLERDTLLSVAAVALQGRTLASDRAYLAPLDPDGVEALMGLLEFTGNNPLVVFNASFNRSHLDRATERYLGVALKGPWIDLYWLLPRLFPEISPHPLRLNEWLRRTGIETFLRHHALGDAWAIAQLFLMALARAGAAGLTSPSALTGAERIYRTLHQSA